MTVLQAASTAPEVLSYLNGARRRGFAVGHGYIWFPDYVIAVTPVGGVRMPNGIEVDVEVASDELWAGRGSLQIGHVHIRPGSVWLPRPTPLFTLSLDPAWVPDPTRLIGWGPGLTPLGDDLVCGYLAGLRLTGRDLPTTACAIHETTSLSRALLKHATRGELPSPAHTLLHHGDPGELLRFGATSGRGLLVGLAAAMGENGQAASEVVQVELELPGDEHTTFGIGIHPVRGGHRVRDRKAARRLAVA